MDDESVSQAQPEQAPEPEQCGGHASPHPPEIKTPVPATEPIARPLTGITFSDVFSPRADNVHLREVGIVLILAALLDYLIYMGSGGLSYAIGVLAIPTGIYACAPRRPLPRALIGFGLCFVALSAKCAWQYDDMVVLVGVIALICAAIALYTGRADAPSLAHAFLPTVVSGPARYLDYLVALFRARPTRWFVPATVILTAGVPALVVAGFALVFYFSNPILGERVSSITSWISDLLNAFLNRFPLTPERVFHWFCYLWFLGALARPQRYPLPNDSVWQKSREQESETRAGAGPVAYLMCLNTLLGVNVLFALYNAFDAYYLAFRRALPPGLNHSQYAHQGALWLTIALALSTFVLGVVFHGNRNCFPNVRRLRGLAWIWIAQNFMLAIWVFARLDLYIRYNGLTPMRIVGVYGTLVVIAGLVLIAQKIRRVMTARWLLRNHAVAFAVGIVLLCVTPLDALTWSVNVPLIKTMAIPRPAVQLTEQRISPEGLMLLTPLLEHPNRVIAEGTAGLLAEWYFTEGQRYLAEPKDNPRRWTTYQFAVARCARALAPFEARIIELSPDSDWSFAIERLRELTEPWI